MPNTEPKIYVDASGKCLGVFVGFQQPDVETVDKDGNVTIQPGRLFDNVPVGGIEVPLLPSDGRDTWDGKQWIPFVAPPPEPTVSDVVEILKAKGIVTDADVASAMNSKGETV